MPRRRSLLLSLVLTVRLAAQDPPAANFDEARVGDVRLPVLGAENATQWSTARRPELLQRFAEHVYGRPPAELGKPVFECLQVRADALGGLATRKQIRVTLPDVPRWEGLDLLLYVPNEQTPAPCFVGLNFGGNHAITHELDVPLSTRWTDDLGDNHVVDFHATEKSRGTCSHRWPLRRILQRGYAVATAYYGDLEPDHENGWLDGLRGAVRAQGDETPFADDAWGAIAVWAQGLSLLADYLQTDALIAADRLAVIGHSRLGKTALWAGARDERFAIVVANESGEGGAALMRRNFGETTAIMTHTFPHWFARGYARFAGDADECPVDQHMLLALIAPRPLYIASADDDLWADPKGEFLAAREASRVYELFDRIGIGGTEMPPVGVAVGEHLGYHRRRGLHELTELDWQHFLDFADRHFAR